MPEWYKKRILQRPGHETQSVTERPSEFYQLELPDFKIPTVTNSEDSIMTGLENRKERDIWEHKGRASGINNTDASLQQEHPSLFLLPFAPEIMGSGLGLGVLKTLGGYAGGYINGRLGKLAGSAIDKTFNTQLFEPTLELAGDFIGFGKGYNALNKIGINRAFRWASKTGKSVPNWFMRPELRTTIEPINQRTIFAENQTPKYNSSQIGNGNRRVYQSPTTFMGIYPRQAVASDFSGVENIEFGNFGYNGQKPNLGLRKLKTEQRSKQLLDSVTEEEKRNASALNWSGKNWENLTTTEQYWLKTLHGNKWNDKLIISREYAPKSSTKYGFSFNDDVPTAKYKFDPKTGNFVIDAPKRQWVEKGEELVRNYFDSRYEYDRLIASGATPEQANTIMAVRQVNAINAYPSVFRNLGKGTYGRTHNINGRALIDYNFRNNVPASLYDANTALNTSFHELGGHGSSLNIGSGTVTIPEGMKDILTEIYKHNEALRPKLRPFYQAVKDGNFDLAKTLAKDMQNVDKMSSGEIDFKNIQDLIKYMEENQEYTARGIATNMSQHYGLSKGWNETQLRKYFTDESVDNLIKNLWGLIPLFGIGLSQIPQKEE